MKLRRQSLTAYAAPLCETVADLPTPQETQVLVRISHCGVCHSDVHLQDGYFKLGDDKKLDVTGGRTLPFTLGHEIAGIVERAGDRAQGVERGAAVAVYPWIGCGQCAACQVGDENICAAPKHLGVTVDGGFATHVLVPHPRYLLDYAPLSPAFAGALMCSGLTAYAALKRLADRAKRGPVLILGLGGVGMMGLSIAQALYEQPPLVADIDPKKREQALKSGAAAAFDPADPGARKAILAKTGGVFGVCDFVGSDKSLTFATGVIAKGGKIVVTGLLGGAFTTPVPMIPMKAMTIEGTMTGTLAEAREMIALAQSGKITPPPIEERPLAATQASLDALRQGQIVGRVVVVPESAG